MSKLVLTEEETMLADMARGFLDGAAPVEAFRKLRDAGETHDAKLWKEMADMGWAGVLVPEGAGGSDMGFSAANVIAREMGKTLVVSPFLSTAVMAATALRQVGDARATAALAQIASGDVTYALAVDEGIKHDPEATTMEARADGNGFRLTGQKTFVVDGAMADRLLVLAKTADGLTLFDIPADRAGITREKSNMIDARDAAKIDFDAVEATGEDVLGQVDDAMAVLRPALQAGQAALAAEMTGLTAGALDMTVGYLKERKQFGIEIGRFQALQHRAAHLWCETEVTASAILNAGRLLDEDPENAALAVSLAKAKATSTATLAVQEGVQMHGGIGMTDAYDMGFYMKRARVSAEWLGDYGYHAEKIAVARGF
ncbi:acyl-CoA dehydrogenase family protein [Sulfitobacter donghicola]|uniref:Acyl-CoA dehydrogenase n=1 Tax=Sulfitobacter donghicola DSW-25 = KCTC 12864 = JCM 14565 TaxID=1300350 RepID=A0A073ICR4_9RHOB|nr:acyl-CoA dehydrogenase [Sulfitobacter donghicola]KEJ88123.1 acyl-CoA dehydrogenase [Sulfitobacter donghicola DSW-25 = KCTC 12864 = JCM 14565]KIN70058.1 Acyl-CoA dehydrogenase family protein [Sulfitobacter donghicola DSW-25 = KCTC 12864 = JCM 14565]